MRTIQDLFRKTKIAWLEEAREKAHELSDGYRVITIEDVLTECPLPSYLHHNTIGSVFNHREFKAVGYTASKRRISHGRIVRQWVSKQAAS